MKQTLFNLSAKASQLNTQQIRLALADDTLIQFVVGARAPAGTSDF